MQDPETLFKEFFEAAYKDVPVGDDQHREIRTAFLSGMFAAVSHLRQRDDVIEMRAAVNMLVRLTILE